MTDARLNIVLLHGWGCDSSTWSPLLPELQQFASVTLLDLPGFGCAPILPHFSLDSVLDTLALQLPNRAIVVGWSLGGMLAVQLATRYPENVIGVITLAANAKFVVADDYSTAMPRATNCQFNQAFDSDAQATLKLFKGLLAQGDPQERQLLKTFRAQAVSEVNSNWSQALTLLADMDNRSAFAQLAQPGLHLFAEKDALVPVAAAGLMRTINPQQNIVVINQSAHAMHWSQPSLVMLQINRFIASYFAPTSGLLDKQKVAQSFSRAAETYDAVAGLQRAVGAKLFAHLPAKIDADTVIVDVGSGTGYFTVQLAQQFTQSQIFGLDLAEGMLQYAAAKSKCLPALPIQWLCADAEILPLADSSVDLIFSSLAIQWCDDLSKLMRELCRVLKPNGRVFIATLGPQTLHELKSAWQQVDNYVHVNRFQTMESVQSAVIESGFQLQLAQQEIRILHFKRLADLTRELKALGAHNVNTGKPEGLTGRTRIAAFKTAYELARTQFGLPATYDVFYFSVQKQ